MSKCEMANDNGRLSNEKRQTVKPGDNSLAARTRIIGTVGDRVIHAPCIMWCGRAKEAAKRHGPLAPNAHLYICLLNAV